MELVHDAKVNGDDLAYECMKKGVLTKSTHTYSIRLAPALTITEKELTLACNKIKYAVRALERLNRDRKKEFKL